jgi:hypothetical protein
VGVQDASGVQASNNGIFVAKTVLPDSGRFGPVFGL